ncbi:hypothetical protein C8R46DRAFT_891763 [Mycena filopes]|nr:hypothetical protein C8R46DRAFT_891763 [Mycena filopes]
MVSGDAAGTCEYFAAGQERSSKDTGSSKQTGRKSVFLKRSKISQARPARTKAENFCLTAHVKVNGTEVFALFDSGCTTEACSPEFASATGIKVFPLATEVTLQLGTAGSQATIHHGTIASLEYDDVKSDEYLDIVHLDQFDLIIGTKFMRKHRMSIDFQFNTLRVAGVPSTTLSVKEECSEVERRNTA